MSFYSVTFAVFFAFSVALYYLAPERLRIPLLLLASTLFYISFVPQYIFILAALIAVDYCAGILIERAESAAGRKTWLAFSIAANLGLMCGFKYSVDVFGKPWGVIPVGLSFHTFQAMAYTIEVYRGRQAAERSLPVYALYVMFFPQLAAGPIERPQALLPQLRKPRPFQYGNVVAGLQLMLWGMFQKYIVADRLGEIVDAVYKSPTPVPGPLVACAVVCFPFQMLCDFGGYSEIALGAAQVLGIRLTRNFNAPFHSDSMAEYWKRWHISLSTWMRDYVFFPLCGRRPRMPRICASIVAVFLANGLWHGARWNYLISGLLHGTYRVTELLGGRAISRAGWTLSPAWTRPVRIVRTLLVFALMAFAFIFFRSENLTQSLLTLRQLLTGWHTFGTSDAMVSASGLVLVPFSKVIAAAALIVFIEIVQRLRSAEPLRPRIAALPGWCRWSLYYAAAAAMLLLAAGPRTDFIYFRF